MAEQLQNNIFTKIITWYRRQGLAAKIAIPSVIIFWFLVASSIVLASIAIKEITEVETEAIPFQVLEEKDHNMAKGQTRVKQEGKDGTKELEYKVTFVFDKENKRELISETVIEEPRSKIVMIGTIEVKEIKETADIGFTTTQENDPQLKQGETKVKIEGKNGKKEVTYRVTWDDKKEIKREKIFEVVMIQPINKIVLTGTKTPETVSQKNAVKKAKSYLDYSAFSHDGLVEQLEYEQFSHADAVYGADNSGANWNEQAAKKAKSYMAYSSFSRGSLIEQLMYEKFTPEQAEYGANAVGL